MYVPILSTLEFIFKSKYVVEMLKNSDTDDFKQIFVMGSFFKTHPLFSTEKQTLQIQLFYDDFEVANPLGSKQGLHKLVATYFTVRNLPPKWNSFLANIHLCALFSCTRS